MAWLKQRWREELGGRSAACSHLKKTIWCKGVISFPEVRSDGHKDRKKNQFLLNVIECIVDIFGPAEQAQFVVAAPTTCCFRILNAHIILRQQD